jgi:hypothetical protein
MKVITVVPYPYLTKAAPSGHGRLWLIRDAVGSDSVTEEVAMT